MKNVLITGATQGIGFETAKAFIKNGDRVISISRNADKIATAKLFVPLLKKGKNASMVNISSIVAKLGSTSLAYGVAKAGVTKLSATLAKSLAPDNIRVNTVSPGLVKSGFHIHNGVMDEDAYPAFIEGYESQYPLGVGEPTDIVGAIMFLTGEGARWITGANIVVDGGRSVNI